MFFFGFESYFAFRPFFNYQQMIQAVTKEQVEQAVKQFINPAQLGLVVAGSLPEPAAKAPPAAGPSGNS